MKYQYLGNLKDVATSKIIQEYLIEKYGATKTIKIKNAAREAFNTKEKINRILKLYYKAIKTNVNPKRRIDFFKKCNLSKLEKEFDIWLEEYLFLLGLISYDGYGRKKIIDG